MEKRVEACMNCRCYTAYSPNAGFCSAMAVHRRGINANRDATSVCADFDPVTDNLPPVPQGTITWNDYDPNIPELLPIYGGSIIIRYLILDQDGKKVGNGYIVQTTPFNGRLSGFKKTFPYDKFHNYIPTHFAYINDLT